MTGIASIATRGARLIGMLLLTPFLLSYLGAEAYGLWATLTALVVIFGSADLGLGNGVVNAIASAHGRDDVAQARRTIAGAMAMLSSLALALATAFLIFSNSINWAALFGVNTHTTTINVKQAVVAFIICALLTMPASLVTRVQVGYQRGYIAEFWQAGATLLTLTGTLVLTWLHGSLALLILVAAGTAPLAMLGNGVAFFATHPELRPRVQDIDKATVFALLRSGRLFLVIQLSMVFAYQSDLLIVGHMLGASLVVQLAIPMRLFMLVPTALGFMILPLWPAYGEAIARADFAWIRRAFGQSLWVAVAVSSPVALLLAIAGPTLLRLWVGPIIQPGAMLMIGLALWSVFFSASQAIAAFLSGAGLLRTQASLAVMMMAANVLLSVLLTQEIGVAGAVWGSVIAQLAFVFLPCMFVLPRVLRSPPEPSLPLIAARMVDSVDGVVSTGN